VKNANQHVLKILARLAQAAVIVTVMHAAAPSAAAQSLDFDYYKTRVEPIFLKKRPSHARCAVCHINSTNAFVLQPLDPGSPTWTEEQSRKNFEVVSRLVFPGDVTTSPLLVHPLAPEEGGDYFHSGGRQFKTRKDPEWLILAAWAKGAKK
jgi:hypothetical protein